MEERLVMAGLSIEQALDHAERWVDERVAPGVAVAVAVNGAIVAERYAGRQAAGGGGPITAESMFPVASLTKPVVATAALRLVETGRLALDEPVRRLVPRFATSRDGAEKRSVTIRQLLSHSGGVAGLNPGLEEKRIAGASFDDLVTVSAEMPLEVPPGTRTLYSNPGYWVLGGALTAASEQNLDELLQNEVLDPFGMRETAFQPTDPRRLVRRYGPPLAKVINTEEGRAVPSPSGGLFATARDLVRFASVFVIDGRLPDGQRVLSPASVAAMGSDQNGGLPGGIADLREWPNCPWGLGWEVQGEKRFAWTGDYASPGTVVHIGQSGCLLWADPVSGISCAVLANRDLGSRWTLEPARWATLANAITVAVERAQA